MQLEGKSVVVTGAGRGLGSAIALAMSKEGAGITGMSRTREELETLARTVQEWDGECEIVTGDVSRPEDVDRMVKQALKRFRTVDVLVNNAAIIGPARFLQDADTEAWRHTIDVNLNGAFYCCRRILPIMVEKRSGKILNISSGLAQMPFPRFCAYSVTKAGISQLTRSLSEEFRSMNIQVNSIDPGVMNTSMQDRIRALGDEILGPSLYANFVDYKESGVLRDPAEVARLAVFLASSKANHITGTLTSPREFFQGDFR